MWTKFLSALERFAYKSEYPIVVGRGQKIYPNRVEEDTAKTRWENEDMESTDKGDNT
jgi:hypothetical protein